ncbi:DUF5329 domain-containing protein [Agarivorans sp. TSD2052]|uniref:DUF5329 family protein n=1 Tax=Agarivorans sp. TSD2052 TaxID=2937286 RepID=UPI00200D44D1|nr:DUF5329 family protein [Agarivorans sp. TSD2052]UPW17080.1 DUF5329 domain-containing protein [Agarivorans sp. TSD2052]
MQFKQWFFTTLILWFGLQTQFALSAEAESENWPKQQVRIEALLHAIEQTDLVFTRNGSEHDSAEAGAHLRMKLKRAQNSWFAPSKEKWTAEMFIDKLASKSSLSGKPYMIRFSDGQQVESGTWLYQQLAAYDNQQVAHEQN